MMLSECYIWCGLQDTLSGTVGLNIHTLAWEGLQRWQGVAHRREATPEVPRLIQPRAQAQADSWLLSSSPAAFSLSLACQSLWFRKPQRGHRRVGGLGICWMTPV